MSKEKQIEEIRRVVSCCDDTPMEVCATKTCSQCRAELLYNAGYRKQSEGEWVLREGFNRLVRCTACGYEYNDLVECTNFCGNCGAKMKGGE